MQLTIKKATKKTQKLRLMLRGPSGSGKTFSALTLGTNMSEKVVMIDTEQGSSELYADLFNFDVLNYTEMFGNDYHPDHLIEAIKECEKEYDVIIIDSLSHFWEGNGGITDIVDKAGGRFQDWKAGSKLYKSFVDSLLFSRSHIIACARVKSDYQMTEENGKKVVKKVGLKTVQREGLEYEFTTVLDLQGSGSALPDKDRTGLINPAGVIINANLARTIIDWLQSGESVFTVLEDIKKIDPTAEEKLRKAFELNYKIFDLNQITPAQANKLFDTAKDLLKRLQEKHIKEEEVEPEVVEDELPDIMSVVDEIVGPAEGAERQSKLITKQQVKILQQFATKYAQIHKLTEQEGIQSVLDLCKGEVKSLENVPASEFKEIFDFMDEATRDQDPQPENN
ncbi:MAG: hypothetical protein OHK0017_08140 [Patescibacteria group bacterium]